MQQRTCTCFQSEQCKEEGKQNQILSILHMENSFLKLQVDEYLFVEL